MLINHSKQDEMFVRKYSWIGMLVVCALSVPLHFLYGWSGKNPLVGLFTPINESIWEHLKLVFWPLLLWWGLGYISFKDANNLSLVKWFTSSAVVVFFSMAFIVGWYYTWVYGLATESSIIDIGSLFIAVPIGQLLAIHVYKAIQPRMLYFILSLILILLFAGLFINFTLEPPELPIFIPPNG